MVNHREQQLALHQNQPQSTIRHHQAHRDQRKNKHLLAFTQRSHGLQSNGCQTRTERPRRTHKTRVHLLVKFQFERCGQDKDQLRGRDLFARPSVGLLRE